MQQWNHATGTKTPWGRIRLHGVKRGKNGSVEYRNGKFSYPNHTLIGAVYRDSRSTRAQLGSDYMVQNPCEMGQGNPGIGDGNPLVSRSVNPRQHIGAVEHTGAALNN